MSKNVNKQLTVQTNKTIIMAVTFECLEGVVISHELYFKNVYKQVKIQSNVFDFCLNPILFEIWEPFKKNVKKRKRKASENNEDNMMVEYMDVKHKFYKMKCRILKPLEILCIDANCRKTDVGTCELAQSMSEKTTKLKQLGLQGGNNSDSPLCCLIQDIELLIPPFCRFYAGCIKEQLNHVNGQSFDLIVADPPWWNKYIRRIKSCNPSLSYSMMYNEEIAELPICNISSDNALLAMWCTNSPNNMKSLLNDILPSWGFEYITTWYWVKVTKNLEPVCEFSVGTLKQPYERIVLAKKGNLKKEPELNRLVVSVPCSLHSHKPPLTELLSSYLNVENPNILELFARNLLPNTTSIGFEPLKWQHKSIYINEQDAVVQN